MGFKEQARKVLAVEEFGIGGLTFGKENLREQRGPADPSGTQSRALPHSRVASCQPRLSPLVSEQSKPRAGGQLQVGLQIMKQINVEQRHMIKRGIQSLW